jgi:fumarate hydratase class II
MGEMPVPIDAYYGASTARAVLNFPISDLRLPRSFIRALGLIKQAAAEANEALGLLDPEIASAISVATDEVATGKWDSHFVVDVFQTGSGTSTNMNANEVIAHRAAELLSGRRVHPNDQVNLGQSSNDVIPSAMQIAAASALLHSLLPALDALEASLEAKSGEFWDVIKTGRTHLQDATPMRLGQVLHGFAGQLKRSQRRIERVMDDLGELPLGGTAVGTGVGTHPEFAAKVIEGLCRSTGLGLHETDNHFQAQNNLDAVLAASAALRGLALSLIKLGEDIRWLASGPRAGLGELELPAVQPGSSIMPGKVNPVIIESMLQVCAQVIGNDATLVVAAQNSHFELNMSLPIAAYALLQSITLLSASVSNLDKQCVQGLRATGRGPALVGSGLALATGLVPSIGYDEAARVAYEAASTGETVLEAAKRLTNVPEDELERLLDPARML